MDGRWRPRFRLTGAPVPATRRLSTLSQRLCDTGAMPGSGSSRVRGARQETRLQVSEALRGGNLIYRKDAPRLIRAVSPNMIRR